VVSWVYDLQAAGAQSAYKYSEGQFGSTLGISAVYSDQLNAFEGQNHVNTDDLVVRYWDDGRKTIPVIGWEGHDEGDTAPKLPQALSLHFEKSLG
jgi:hypothetical protein